VVFFLLVCSGFTGFQSPTVNNHQKLFYFNHHGFFQPVCSGFTGFQSPTVNNHQKLFDFNHHDFFSCFFWFYGVLKPNYRQPPKMFYFNHLFVLDLPVFYAQR